MFDGASTSTIQDGVVLLCVVRPASAILTKKIRQSSTGWAVFGDYDLASRVRAKEYPVSGLEDLAAILEEAATDPKICAIRGGIRPEFVDVAMSERGVRRLAYDRPEAKAPFEERARRWVACDIDSFDLPDFVDPVRDTEHVIDAALEHLPEAFQDASCYWQLTSGHGIKPGGRCRLWFWLSRATTNRELKVWLANAKLDPSVFATVQPIYTAAPLLPKGTKDFLPVRSGLRAAAVDEVDVPDPEALAQHPSYRALGTSPALIADFVEAALDAIGDPPVYPDGRGFHAPIKAAFRAAIREDGSAVDQEALLEAIDAVLHERGHTRPVAYIEARCRDARRWLAWWVRVAAENEAKQAAAAPSGPHFRRPRLTGEAASKRLQRVVRAWLDRVECYLDAQDWIAEEALRIAPLLWAKNERRIREQLLKQGNLPDEAALQAQIQAAKAAPGIAKRAARRAAATKFGKRAATGTMPRIQIKGAAGLGKTAAVVAEYIRRPTLWDRNIAIYVRDLALADEFACNVREAAIGIKSNESGHRPRAIVIRGRSSDGMCEPGRLKVVTAAKAAGADSIYTTCCHTPAFGGNPASYCSHYHSCRYIGQFRDQEPGLRILPHARMSIRQPNDLRIPIQDLTVVDETAIGALTTSTIIEPSLLSDIASYASENPLDGLVPKAAATGQVVAETIASGADLVATMETADVTPEMLRQFADAAVLAANAARPAVYAGMDDKAAMAALQNHQRHQGKAVAAVLTQAARDIEAGRTASIGIEWDANHEVELEDGTEAIHPVIRHHGISPALGIPSKGALLALDADASLRINRRLFGDTLRGFTIPAIRQAHVIQVSNVAMATSSLAPDERLVNNHEKAAKLRGRVAKFIRREAADKKTLVIGTLPVRRAFSGETRDKVKKVEVATKFEGADLSHYGRHLGANVWRDHDTMIVLNREQLPPLAAERTTRAVYADAPDVTLNLPGEYGREVRRYDMRDGSSQMVTVRVHPDLRVQEIVEIKRENAIGQAIDRLRLIHRNPSRPARVVVLSNLPIPGLVVDELKSLNDVLEGGSPIERALERSGGVLILSRNWLYSKFNDLGFTSLRTAGRELKNLMWPLGNRYLYCRMATYTFFGQKRPSRVLVRRDVANPRAELTRQTGKEVVDFRWLDDEPDPVPTYPFVMDFAFTIYIGPPRPDPQMVPPIDLPLGHQRAV